MSSTVNADTVLSLYESYKRRALRALAKEKVEVSAFYLEKAARLMYSYNLKYVDDDLEAAIQKIAAVLNLKTNVKTAVASPERVVIVDSFGLSFRGLAWIYSKAVIDSGRALLFIAPKHVECSDEFAELKQYLCDAGAEIEYVGSDFSGRVKGLLDAMSAFGPQDILFHGTPWDIAALAAISKMPRSAKRYLINLTDHAFWLGKGVFDKFIEFRHYGASISVYGRGISCEKLVMLPYYPVQLIKQVGFEGLPFDYSDGFFLSGGASYKTEGSTLFPIMVDRILSSHDTISFIFLSEKIPSWFENLQRKYPNRVFYECERSDLFEVMKRATFYLSTYPMYGGLMTQIAAAARTVPVTLLCEGQEPSALLLPCRKVTIDYSSVDDAVGECIKLINCTMYRKMKEEEIEDAVLSPEGFADGLNTILEEKAAPIEQPEKVDDAEFLNGYIRRNATKKDLAMLVFTKRDLFHGTIFDTLTWIAVVEKIKNKSRGGFMKNRRGHG